jgi:uncharacterized membrane protein SirB2
MPENSTIGNMMFLLHLGCFIVGLLTLRYVMMLRGRTDKMTENLVILGLIEYYPLVLWSGIGLTSVGAIGLCYNNYYLI